MKHSGHVSFLIQITRPPDHESNSGPSTPSREGEQDQPAMTPGKSKPVTVSLFLT